MICIDGVMVDMFVLCAVDPGFKPCILQVICIDGVMVDMFVLCAVDPGF